MARAAVNSITNTATGRRFTLSRSAGGVRLAWVEGDLLKSVIITESAFTGLCAHPLMKLSED
ncbi:hypothetical protein ACIPMZ_17925 [Scandinavium goeteborgense]|uniref:hypothetical protein n=1 Tax=Scandinavium goeteborgense TaxID=1851514 RepID=UPI003800B152